MTTGGGGAGAGRKPDVELGPGSGQRRGPHIAGRGEPGLDEARLRKDLSVIVRSALAAVEPGKLVRRALEEGSPGLPPRRGSASGRPDDDDRTPAGHRTGGAASDVVLLAVGKAAAGMASGALALAGPRIREGVVLVPHGVDVSDEPLGPLRLLRGGHPLPDDDGVRGARAILEAATGAGSDDTLLFLLSGGGSALLTLPAPGVELEDVREVTALLMRAGADVRELNTVRKHLDRLKGGGLARAAAPTPVRAAVISDVVGDPFDVIASGPVSPDPTTFDDALNVLRRRTGGRAPERVRRRLEAGARGELDDTPGPGDPCFHAVEVRIVGNAATAVEGARAAAEERGYRCKVLGTGLTGEARRVGRALARLARRARSADEGDGPCCLLAAGETTVTVTGDGRGGRNQEVALGAAAALDGMPGVLLASVGTDGVDGPTDAAGAVVSGSTLERAQRAGLDASGALERNDADTFFQGLGDRIVTGPTGTNVMDVQVILLQ